MVAGPSEPQVATGSQVLDPEPSRLDPSGEYQRRRDRLTARIEHIHSTERRISLARGIGFLAIIGAAWAAIGNGLWWGWSIAAAAAFVTLVAVHRELVGRREALARAVAYYQRGQQRLQFDWKSGDPGERHRDDNHPYSSDLDLFGHGSLFQLICQAGTQAGHDCLAHWLERPATAEDIRLRQAAVRDLRDRLDMRERLALLAGEVSAVDVDQLQAWCRRPLPARSRWLYALGALVTAVASAGLVGTAISPPWYPLLATGIAAIAAVLAWSHLRVTPALASIHRRAHDLEVIAGTLRVIETEPFTAPPLIALQRRLQVRGAAPSAVVARLGRLLSVLEWQYNQLFLPFTLLFLWPMQLGVAIYRWRQAHGDAVLGWLETLGELEALGSLAGYAFEQPDTRFPEIVDDGPVFEADDLGHPLLAPAVRVCNDIRFGPEPQIYVVSGSNMSGKSTLLRTVGINAVLALAGAPVAARRLRLSPVQVAATLHIQDSLLAGRSRFFAEILKLRQILELTRRPLPVLFLIDEIFHGTNSHDRQIGGTALIHRGLLDRGAIGLVSTHDQAFAVFADSLAPRIQNVHFADYVRDGAIQFDYRLRPGAVQHSNALELMRSIGIEV